MKKKLLALAVAGAFVAPVAMADTANVTVYGQLNVAYTNVDNDKNATTQGTSSNHISSESSRIGFKGTEDLGGGLSAIWQIENGINMDYNNSTAGALNSRNTFVGLSGESWGSVLLGNNDSTYKTAFRGFDAFGDTVADNRSVMGVLDGNATTLDARNSSSVTYNSPDFSGFKVAAQYVAGAETATASTDKKGNSYNLAGTYNAGPITAAVAYTNLKNGSANTGTASGLSGLGGTLAVDDKIKGFRVGGSYKMDAITVSAFYERNKVEMAAAQRKANGFYLAGKFAVSGSDTLKVAYGNRDDLEVGGAEQQQTGVSQFSLGYDHAMSKRTSVYALYTKLDNDNNANNRLGPLATNAHTNAAVGTGASPSAIALGIKHSF